MRGYNKINSLCFFDPLTLALSLREREYMDGNWLGEFRKAAFVKPLFSRK